MYKDKNRQREAVKEATRRYRKRKHGITQQGITPVNLANNVIPERRIPVIPDTALANKDGTIIGPNRGAFIGPERGCSSAPLTKERQLSQKGFND